MDDDSMLANERYSKMPAVRVLMFNQFSGFRKGYGLLEEAHVQRHTRKDLYHWPDDIWTYALACGPFHFLVRYILTW